MNSHGIWKKLNKSLVKNPVGRIILRCHQGSPKKCQTDDGYNSPTQLCIANCQNGLGSFTE